MLLKLILDYLRYIKFLIKCYLINLFKFKKSLITYDRLNYQEYLNKQLEKTTNQKRRDIWLEENYYNNKTKKFIHFFLKHKNILHNSKKTLSIGSRVGNEVLAIKSYGCECVGIDLVPYKELVVKGDMHNLNFNDNTFDYVIASNMIHHVPYPIKFFKEINRILKKDGKLIIFDSYCSILLQLVMILMKHEGFDFTINVWDAKNPKSDEQDVWDGNIGVTNLIFDNKDEFNKNLGDIFSIEHEKLTECFIFLNSGGVTSQTFYIPLSDKLLNILNCIDNFLIKFFPNIFCLGRRIVLKKKN